MRVELQTRPPEAPAGGKTPIAGVVRPAARFGLHVLVMCVVMCVSLAVATTVLGFFDAQEEAPELSALVVAAVLAGAMVVWMRLRRMEWRPTVEMAAPALVAGVLMVAGYWMGVVTQTDLIGGVCGVACVTMIAVMLFRFRTHSTHTGSRHAPR
jgi:uncharacterized membrane protein YfcA